MLRLLGISRLADGTRRRLATMACDQGVRSRNLIVFWILVAVSFRPAGQSSTEARLGQWSELDQWSS